MKYLLACIDDMLHLYPISDVIIDGCETLEWDRQLKVADNWEPLLNTVKDLKDIIITNEPLQEKNRPIPLKPCRRR